MKNSVWFTHEFMEDYKPVNTSDVDNLLSKARKISEIGRPNLCNWVYDEHDFKWDTQCGESFVVLEGTPAQNNMKYCCYCGNLINEQS